MLILIGPNSTFLFLSGIMIPFNQLVLEVVSALLVMYWLVLLQSAS